MYQSPGPGQEVLCPSVGPGPGESSLSPPQGQRSRLLRWVFYPPFCGYNNYNVVIHKMIF